MPQPKSRVASHPRCVPDNLAPGKYQVELQSQDLAGRPSPNSVVQVLIEPRRSSEVSDKPQPLSKREDTVIYHLLIDRFRGPQGHRRPRPLRDDGREELAGVQAAVEAGYFQRLGIAAAITAVRKCARTAAWSRRQPLRGLPRLLAGTTPRCRAATRRCSCATSPGAYRP